MQHSLLVRAATALALVCSSQAAKTAEPGHPIELEEVIVTASPIGDPERLATIAGVIGRDELARSGYNNIGDALASVPGVTSSGFAAGAGRPVIRGMDANRVRTLQDGIGSFDVSDVGPDHGVPIEPFAAERIEVVRGAATVRYGSQALGGVVNAISNRVPLHLIEDSVNGDALASFGTVADGRDFAGQLNVRGGGAFAFHADAADRHTDDYATPDGPMPNSWLDGRSGALGVAWLGNEHRLGLGVERNESQYGIPAGDAFIDMEQTRLLLRSRWALPLGAFEQLTLDGGWADYAHSERDEVETHATFLDEEWEARAEAMAGEMGFLHETALGVQMQRKDFSALGEGEEYLAPTRTDTLALFAFTEARLGAPLRLQLGARVEDVKVEGTPADDVPVSRRFTPVSASAGLLFEPMERWRIGFSLSSATRAPAQTELYARGVHEATGTWEIGDAALAKERATTAELSLRWRAGSVHADAAMWVSDFRNFIYGELTGRTCSEEGDCVVGDGEELAELLYTQQGARFHGAEGHAQVELFQGTIGDLHLDLMGDVVRAKLDGGGGHVPRIPPFRIGGGLSWHGMQFDAGVFLRYSGRQARTAANETPTAAFSNLDAQFAWRPWARRTGLELALVGRNLTDSRQRNAVALNKDEVMLPGRELRLVLRAHFD